MLSSVPARLAVRWRVASVPAGSPSVGAPISALAGRRRVPPADPDAHLRLASEPTTGGPINEPRARREADPARSARPRSTCTSSARAASPPTPARCSPSRSASRSSESDVGRASSAAYGDRLAAGHLTSLVNFGRPATVVPNLAILSRRRRRQAHDRPATAARHRAGARRRVRLVLHQQRRPPAPTTASRLIPVTPGRILDTRDGMQPPGAGPIGSGQRSPMPVRGVDSRAPDVTDIVPNSPNVVGVLLNVVGITDRPGGVSTYLVGRPRPARRRCAADHVERQPPAGDDQGQPRDGARSAPTATCSCSTCSARPTSRSTSSATCRRAPTASTATGRVVPLSVAVPHVRHPRSRSGAACRSGPGMAETLELRRVRRQREDRRRGGRQAERRHRQPDQRLADPPVPAVPVLSLPHGLAGRAVNRSAYPRPQTSNVNTDEGGAVPNMSMLPYGANGTDGTNRCSSTTTPATRTTCSTPPPSSSTTDGQRGRSATRLRADRVA